MKNIILSITLIVAMLGFSVDSTAKDRRYKGSKIYQLKDFSKVDIEGGFRITLIQGDKNSLKVEVSDEDILDDIKVEVDNDELEVWIDKDFINTKRIHLTLTFRDIHKLELSGGINLLTEGHLEFDDLDLFVEGGAKIDMKLKANSFTADGEGGVKFDFDGAVDYFLVDIEGAGKVNAFDLKADEVEVRIAGVGFANVYAEKKLDVLLEGAGKVNYRGNPSVRETINGLGKVSQH